MKTKKRTAPPRTATPFEKEVRRLHAIGKAPEIIAIRLGAKLSRILPLIANPAA